MASTIHQSAYKHVNGTSVYVDDIPVHNQLLHGYVLYSPHAHAAIRSLNTAPARHLPGVAAVLSAKDIPGVNQMGPIIHDEPCLAEEEVRFVGQAVCLIAAESEEQARHAAAAIEIEYEILPAVLSLKQAMAVQSRMGPERKIERGRVREALDQAPLRLSGRFETGAQEHWYLETQTALCLPGEDREYMVYSSTQHPSETQAVVAEVLGVPRNMVTVEIRRMGGAFGGKETQANHVAAWAALLSRATARPVKLRLFRDDDQIMTGKRHPFLIRYEVGFDEQGRILALDVEQNANGGSATDLSFAILERAMFHADNAYYIPNMRVIGRVWKTNLPSNTAFRGFGAPQGIAGMENIMDRIARRLGLDPLEVRRINFYDTYKRDVTHYGQQITQNHLPVLYKRLTASSGYFERRKQVEGFNAQNEFVKRGLACTPVKFGISFTTAFLNQAGALVHVYQDGTVQVNHGGTEMGQGLHTKIRQIAAAELGVDQERILITPTNTSKVPNTSATAASSGTDLNGMAVKNAVDKLKFRMAYQVTEYFNQKDKTNYTLSKHIMFKNNSVFDATNPHRSLPFAEAAQICYLNQIPLSATGFYKTPDIYFDREKGQGKPFHYFAYGMAVSEVEIDLLTGRHTLIRTDILHDVGDSVNPDLDIGQIQGAFVQGAGWCTMEECKWDENGRLLTHSPDTYKIPGIHDIPQDFRVQLLEKAPNEGTIRQSKAVGEPPFVHGLSVWFAIKDALSSIDNHKREPELGFPATNEAIVLAAERLKNPKN